MEQIVGVKLETTPKVLGVRIDAEVKKGQKIVVETSLGVELGEVWQTENFDNETLKFFRLATSFDEQKALQNIIKAKDYLQKTKEKAQKLTYESSKKAPKK